MLNRIYLKIIIVVGLTTIVIIGIYSYFSIHSQSYVLLAEVERHANQLSETVKRSTKYDMLLNRTEDVHRIINTIGQQAGIHKVRVFNKEGEIIYSSYQSDIGHMVDKNTEACYACHAADKPLEGLSIAEKTRIFRLDPDSTRIFGIIEPIYNEQSCWKAPCHAHPADLKVLGVLDVTMSLKEIDKQIYLSKIKIGIFALSAILAISIILALFIRKFVHKPVNNLVQATKQVAAGNLNYTIEDIGSDELGLLAKSFNNMTKKLAEARLQLFQSDKMASLGRLAAGVAHEINNPLTGVLTYSSFLLKRTKKNSEMQEDLKVIVRETMRSREIVKSLLDFARQSVPKKNKADINEIIDNAINVVENQLTISNIKIVKNLHKNLSNIMVDANQMQQVFINLLVNAADALDKDGGKITLTSSPISLSPLGITQIRAATCLKNHSLIDNEFKIKGMPSIKLKAKSNGHDGFINLDPIYGKHRNHYGIPFSKNKLFQLYCTKCNTSLVNKNKKCQKCGSPTYTINIPSQGTLEGCTKFACHWQKWDVVDRGGQKEYVEVKIADTGHGIVKEDLARIFEPFYSTKGQKGTGLGLAVIWGIIDNHDGTINVQSEVGKGTTFIIRVPL